MQVINENPVLFTEEMQRKTTEDLIGELVTVADEIPIFAGYAEQAPYYGHNSIDKIREQKHRNITCRCFDGADFTLRRCNLNKKIHYDGYQADNASVSGLYPLIVEEICKWLMEIH